MSLRFQSLGAKVSNQLSMLIEQNTKGNLDLQKVDAIVHKALGKDDQ